MLKTIAALREAGVLDEVRFKGFTAAHRKVLRELQRLVPKLTVKDTSELIQALATLDPPGLLDDPLQPYVGGKK